VLVSILTVFTAGSGVLGQSKVMEALAMSGAFTGASLSNEIAYQKADAVFEAEVLDPGIASPDAPGEIYLEGMRVKILRNFKGERKGEVAVDLSLRTFPKEEAETVPQKGDKLLFFVVADKSTANRVIKLLPATEDNVVAIKKIQGSSVPGRKGGHP
jgi:hypothetical protein